MKKNPVSHVLQRGITLVEAISTLGIMSAVAIGTIVLSSEYSQDARTTGAAEHMRIVAQAAQSYVRDNRTTVMGQATTSSPALITTAMLSAAGYLPSGFSASNAYQHTVCALVIEPTAGTLHTLVVAEGGQALDNVTLAHFSASMGAGGGGRFTTTPGAIQGAGGGWSIPVGTFDNLTNHAGRRCDGTTTGRVQVAIGAPVYAQWLDASDTADPGFLSRDTVPGNPGANTMQTNINMGGNRITHLGGYIAGAACPAGTADGELGQGARSEVLTCSSGTWLRQGMAYWGANVANYAALPACNASNMGETRRVTGMSGLFVCSGLRWDAALNESNNFSLPQHLQVAGNATISGNATINGSTRLNGAADFYGTTTARSTFNANAGINIPGGQAINSPGALSIEAAGNLHLKPWGAGGQVVIGGSGGSGNLTAAGRITTNEYLRINGIAARGVACSPNGLVARESSGALLNCQSGVWRASGELGNLTIIQGTCPNGQTCVLGTTNDWKFCTIRGHSHARDSRQHALVELSGTTWRASSGCSKGCGWAPWICFR